MTWSKPLIDMHAIEKNLWLSFMNSSGFSCALSLKLAVRCQAFFHSQGISGPVSANYSWIVEI